MVGTGLGSGSSASGHGADLQDKAAEHMPPSLLAKTVLAKIQGGEKESWWFGSTLVKSEEVKTSVKKCYCSLRTQSPQVWHLHV